MRLFSHLIRHYSSPFVQMFIILTIIDDNSTDASVFEYQVSDKVSQQT